MVSRSSHADRNLELVARCRASDLEPDGSDIIRAMSNRLDLLEWLRDRCARYAFDVAAFFRRAGQHPWPLVAADERELERQLDEGGHLLPLPKEPAALANVLEVSIVDFLLTNLAAVPGAEARRGTENLQPCNST
jgi:hypothetical protein